MQRNSACTTGSLAHLLAAMRAMFDVEQCLRVVEIVQRQGERVA